MLLEEGVSYDQCILSAKLTGFESLQTLFGGPGQQWTATGQGLLLEEVTISPTLALPELTQDWGIGSWRAQTEPCAPGPRRKEQ